MIRTQTIAAALLASAGAAFADCPPPGYDRARLEALRIAEFALPAAERDVFALAIADCLAAPDPFLRDDIAFTSLAHLLRGAQLADATRQTLLDRLQPQLEAPDPLGFTRPFAALVLAEIARSDRLDPFMTAPARDALAIAAGRYLMDVRDYRGFDEREGWRHGVAHGADLAMQLARNPAVTGAHLRGLLDVARTQVHPADGRPYIYGESERLAAVVLAVASRRVYSEADWTQWLQELAASPPPPIATWADAYRSQHGLAALHNLKAFLNAIYVNASISGGDLAVLVPGAEAALRAMP